jgi:hypothetical protein
MICCAFADGEFIALVGVCLQVNELGIERQKIERCRMARFLLLTHGQNPERNAAIFEQCATFVLIQFIDSPGINDEFARKPVALLMDDFSLDRR